MIFLEQEALAPQDTLSHVATPAAPVAEQKGDIFKDMIKELHNNQEWSFSPFGSLHLPYLFYDTDGFHYYANDEALESSHQYTLKEEKPVRVSDGMAPKLDLSISRNVALMWVVGAALIVLFSMVAKKYRKSI